MLTRVTIQGSLVALQQHIRSANKNAPPGRERSCSISSAEQEQRQTDESSHEQVPQRHNFSFAPLPVAVEYPRQWAPTQPSPMESQAIPVADDCEEIIEADTPTPTYSYAVRSSLIHHICCFLGSWSTTPVDTNPHGWECLRRAQATNTSTTPSCSSNSCNNYNRAHPTCGDPLHYLYCTTIPTISMHEYLMRLTEYFRTTDAVFITATSYFTRASEKFRELHGRELVTPWSLHRLYFVCCVIAAKWHEDVPFDNQYYASVGGISTYELSHIETAILSLLDFNAYADKESVAASWKSLRDLAAFQEVQRCPWPHSSSHSVSQWYQNRTPRFTTFANSY